ncbi:MAG: MFS transporter [Chloroflexi bacterium]|nr:MFS transporter [Chloroflexota bacterium]
MTTPPTPTTRQIKIRGIQVSRGHVVAAVVFMANALAVGGVMLTFGLFVEPLEQEFGWSRAEISGALSAGLLVNFFTVPIGAVADHLGARATMTASLVVIAIGIGLRPWMTELWHLYALTSLVAVGLPGATSLATDRLISGWFTRTRGRALAITGAGNQIGGLTVLPGISLVFALSGWQTGYIAIAALFLAAAVVAFALVRDSRQATGSEGEPEETLQAPLSDALRSPTFYALMGVFVSSAMTEQVIFPQLIPHLQNEGLSDGAATLALAVVSLGGLPGKLVIGRVAERWTGRRTLSLSLGLIMGGTLLLAVAGGSPLVWPAVALFGAGFGSLGVLYALAIVELFGLRAYGAILGSFKSAAALAVLPVPPLTGVVFDITGSYQLILFLGAAVAAIGIPVLLFARPNDRSVESQLP